MKRIFGCVMVVMFLGIVFLLAQSFGGSGHETGKSPYKNKTGAVMKGYLQISKASQPRTPIFAGFFYTTKQSQLVLMALKPGEEIGAEVHKSDQFFRVEEGSGKAVLDNVTTEVRAGFGVVVPGGAKHNIINTGTAPMKLYTIYSPPNHRDGVVHHTAPKQRPTMNTSMVK